MLAIGILGPLQVAVDGRPVALGPGKQRALVAMLALHANEVVSRDRLVDALWPESPPATAAKVVQVYVSQLRKAIPRGALETRPPGYVLRLERGALDAARFETLAARAPSRRPAEALRLLDEALALWRGEALADVAYDDFAQAEIVRLDGLRLAAVEDRLDALLALGRHEPAVPELEALVERHPLRERLRGQLMLALYRSGRQAEALETYRRARRELVDALGVEPGRALQELEGAILRQDPALELERAPAPPAVAPPPSRGVFVGRERELAELAAALEAATAGRGRLVLVHGEPGIGKSRLADEAAHAARAHGFAVLVGRCWEAGGAPPYWPWVQALRVGDAGAEPEALLAAAGDDDGARFRAFEAIARHLAEASEARPTLLVLDDLHAADVPSLLLLRYVARELGRMHVLVVAAYRDEAPVAGAALAAAVAELVREPTTVRLALGGLSEPEVLAYLDRAGAGEGNAELASVLHARTEGNPLFVAETVRLLGGPGAPAAIPPTVRDAIEQRLAHVSEPTVAVLSLAAVLGREFDVDALAALAGGDPLDALDEAAAARVVAGVPGAPARLRFAHVLVRDALYERLSPPRRLALHGRALDALERARGDDPDAAAELAFHALAAEEPARGAALARRAGDRALALLAYEEAARLYRAALAAAARSRPDDRCELLLLLGEAEARAGDAAAAKAAFLEAAADARRLGRPTELARAAIGYGGRWMAARAGGDVALVPLLEEALAGLGAGDVELRARLLARLAGALRDEPSRARRDALSGEGVEAARRAGDPAALAFALDGRFVATLAPDTTEQCLAVADELCAVAARVGSAERLVQGHVHRLTALVQLGEVAAATRDLDEAERIARELRQPDQLWQVAAARAMLAAAAGRLDECEALLDTAAEPGERSQPEMADSIQVMQRYTLADFRGRPGELEGALERLVAHYPARPVFRCALAHLRARTGRDEESRQALDELAADDFAALPFDMEWLFAMSFVAEASASVGAGEAAGPAYRLLRPWAHLNVVDYPEGIRGSASHYVGVLAGVTGRPDEARAHLDAAIERNAAMGFEPWLERSRRARGELA